VTNTTARVTPAHRVWVGAAGILALAALASWTLAVSGLFRPNPALPELLSYFAIVLDFAALIIAIVALWRHGRPVWIAIATIVISAAPLLYFIVQSAILMAV
jgi:hypothetical protein